VRQAATVFRRSGFTWLAYLMVAFYGFMLNSLGPITPFLKREMGLSYTVSSLHFTAFAAGILLVGGFGHRLIRRAGRRRSLWIGAAGMSAGALLLVTGRAPAVTLPAALLMGLVGSLILVIVPSALSEEHGECRGVALAEANVLASGLSIAAPLLIGWLAATAAGWRLGLGLVALAPAALYAGLGQTRAPVQATAAPGLEARGRPLPKLFWFYWAGLILAVSVEFCMLSWSGDFLAHGLGLGANRSSQMTSLFLAGMMTGRLVGSRWVRRAGEHRLVLGSLLSAVCGFLLFWLAGPAALVLAGLLITGLGVACLYPMLQSLALRASPGQSVQASARTTLASGVAILASPLLLGSLADAMGIARAYGVVLVLLMGVFAMVQGAHRRPRQMGP
jgi:fucose permease